MPKAISTLATFMSHQKTILKDLAASGKTFTLHCKATPFSTNNMTTKEFLTKELDKLTDEAIDLCNNLPDKYTTRAFNKIKPKLGHLNNHLRAIRALLEFYK